jgi:AcrR family transcriptional regulator
VSEIGGPSRKNVNGASTMEVLIQFGMEELKQSGSVDFNLENVLRESGVSRGSLYHHFGSRHGLISHCEAQLLKESLKSENELIRLLIESGKSGEDLFNLLSAFIRTLGSDTMLQQRGRRIRTIAASMEDDNLQAMLADSQIKGSQYLADSYEIARQQGLIKPTVEIETIVYLTQAMFLGRVLVDITERTDLSDSINEAIVLVLRTLMNPQQ